MTDPVWSPIDQVPKDGSYVIVRGVNINITCIACWDVARDYLKILDRNGGPDAMHAPLQWRLPP